MSDTPALTPASISPVYGPVQSWRFGRSLGIDLLLVDSICSFNCIYCQLGEIHRHTAEQRIYVATADVIAALATVDWNAVDVVTISGNGEPTLALNIGEVIDWLVDHCPAPVMVLTNCMHLHDAATRARLHRAHRVACKLDAIDDATLQRINRPVAGTTLEGIVRGIEALRDGGYPGILALQCMLFPASVARLDELSALIARLRPAEVHLNTPRRPKPRAWYPEARGNHGGAAPVEQVALRTLTLEDAQLVERRLTARHPDVKFLSVYQDAPEN